MATEVTPSRGTIRACTLKLGRGGNRVRVRTCLLLSHKKLKALISTSNCEVNVHDLHLVQNFTLASQVVVSLEEEVDAVVGHQVISGCPHPPETVLLVACQTI